MQQRVLSIENRYVASLIERQAFHSDRRIIRDVAERIKSCGKFVDREWAETHPSVKQIVACAVITNCEKILCLRRSRNSNRLELRLSWTLMVGGHVDEEDMGAADPVLNCVVREIKEETGLEPLSKPHLLGYVTDPETPVGRLHIGAVFRFESTQNKIHFSRDLDNLEFVNATKGTDIEFREPSFVAELANRNRLDPWSTVFIQSWGSECSEVTPHFPGLQLEFAFRRQDAPPGRR